MVGLVVERTTRVETLGSYIITRDAADVAPSVCEISCGEQEILRSIFFGKELHAKKEETKESDRDMRGLLWLVEAEGICNRHTWTYDASAAS